MASNITYWHEWPSNFSNGTRAVEGLGSFFQYSNDALSGFLGIIIIALTFVISFLGLRSFGGDKAFASASFATAFLSILLYRIDLIELPWVISLIVMAVIGLLMARGSNKSSGGL